MTDATDHSLPPIPEGFRVLYSNFMTHIGPVWYRADADGCSLIVDMKPHHLNGGGTVHGGMLMSLADTLLGRTISAVLGDGKAATVSLNCDFLSAAKVGERLTGRGRITRQTRSVVFLAGELAVGERLVLATTGIWKVLGEREAS